MKECLIRLISSSPAQQLRGMNSTLNVSVVYTPKDEHTGIVPLEAMAAHRSSLDTACNSGGLMETVRDGFMEFFVNQLDRRQEFLLSMTKLIRNSQMPEDR